MTSTIKGTSKQGFLIELPTQEIMSFSLKGIYSQCRAALYK